ncbi:MAG: YHS domain protein [Rhodospirillaceae bacterium]|nr:YHS domain protein [Rhodospirillaceae bacterium]
MAYFTESRAIEGKPEFSNEWAGDTWLFASQEHLDLFAADPEAYAPQFGGWCAYALSKGQCTAEVEPDNAWTVHDGALFLNWSERVKETWQRNNLDHSIAVGHDNWEVVEMEITDGEVEYSRKLDSPWN